MYLTAPLQENDIVIVEYTYNRLIADLQNEEFSDGDQPFLTDVLIREPIKQEIEVRLVANVLATFDAARVETLIKNLLYQFIETSIFGDVLLPNVLIERIIDSVAGITDAAFSLFRRTSTGSDLVEPVLLPAHTQAKLLPPDVKISTQ